MGKHLNPLEKEALITRYKGNDKISMYSYCQANNISMTSFRDWIKSYTAGGLEALARKDKTIPDILPEGVARTDENYKREILRLRIENERLKKTTAWRPTRMGNRSIFV